MSGGAVLEQILGNAPAVIAHLDALTRLSVEHGIKSINGNFYKGWAMAASPKGTEDGIALMKRAVTNKMASSNAFHLSHYMSLLAEAQARAGDVQSALVLCADAQEKSRLTEEGTFAAELHRIEGEIRCAAGDRSTEVERCFTSALDVSRQQGAKLFELRAATALARLWRDQGKHGEARNLLAPVYRMFTEGFEIVYLKDANTLLAEPGE